MKGKNSHQLKRSKQGQRKVEKKKVFFFFFFFSLGQKLDARSCENKCIKSWIHETKNRGTETGGEKKKKKKRNKKQVETSHEKKKESDKHQKQKEGALAKRRQLKNKHN